MIKFIIIIFLMVLVGNCNQVYGQSNLGIVSSPTVVNHSSTNANYYESKTLDKQLNNVLLLVSGILITFGLNFLIEPKEIVSVDISFLKNFSKFINRLL